MPSKPRVPSLRGQWATCFLLCVIAGALVLFAHATPKVAALSVGLPLWQQAAISVAVAGLIAGSTAVALVVPTFRRTIPVPASIRSIDLSGSRPIQIGLAAGIGEEFLFRAALQPLAGLWWASAIFAVAHVRTATLAGSYGKRAGYLASVCLAGIALGVTYERIGLLAVVLIHASIDTASLVSLQRLSSAGVSAPAT